MKQFEKVKINAPNRAVHDLSYEKKLSMKMGELTPVLMEECLPGDSFRITTEMLIRFQPMMAPIMHRVNAYVHYFFVPYRIIWNEWEDFITGGQTGELEPNLPKITGTKGNWQTTTFKTGSVADHLGVPVQQFAVGAQGSTLSLSQLPFRAYTQIYNDYYRDPIIDEVIDFDYSSINATPASTQAVNIASMRRRRWEKDYFTTALPNPQLGTPVTLPLGTTAPVIVDLTGAPKWKKADGTDQGTGAASFLDTGPYTALRSAGGGTADSFYDPNGSLLADLSQATAATINDLRRAFALQRWLEKNARGGPRYFEQILSHFGVKSPDARLQRPEYIGGGRVPVKVSEVLQTSESSTTPQGNMAGHAYGVGVTSQSQYFAQEHGLIIGILSVIPRTGYMQGVKRFFLKDNRFDFFFPEFANLGEQELYNNELFMDSDTENKAFGYVPRYQEYRYNSDQVSGELRLDPLNFWHMAREFESAPTLSSEFLECVPTTRIWPIEDPNINIQLIVQMYHTIIAKRPVPKYGTPI